VQFLLSDSEVVRAIHDAHRQPDGRLVIDLPAARLLETAAGQPVLTFSAKSRTAHCGELSARLSPIQFSLLAYVYTHPRAGFEELQDKVWQRRKVSDDAIRRAASKLNLKLLESGFPVEVFSHHSRVSIEKTS